MNSITLDITDILSQDLKSRSTVTDLRVFIEHQQAENVMIDFSKVLFATRSFIDEYYNQFIKDGGNIPQKHIETIHVPDDIQSIIHAVSKTQKGEKKEMTPKGTVASFSTVKELNGFLSSLMM